jgi:hypothetical protein
MRKFAFLIALLITPCLVMAQGVFDKFEDEQDVTSVIVTKNMFKLLAQIDVESDDPEVKEYMNLVDNLENIKIFITDNPEVAARMKDAVNSYVASNNKLSELMRVKDDGKNIKFYSREGKSENYVSELLMFLDGKDIKMDDLSGDGTIIMSITGNIDLKQVSKLTKDLNVPGSEELKNIDQKQKG